VNLRLLLGILIRVFFSLLFAGIFYTVWLAIAMVGIKVDNSALKVILWVSAPIFTAVGFATGIAIFELLPATRKSRFLDVLKWALIGCAIGAGAVWWFGPMLIVFGMFGIGTASVALRQMLLSVRAKKHNIEAANL